MMSDWNTPHITLPGSKRGTDPVIFNRRTMQLRAPTHTGHHPHPPHTKKAVQKAGWSYRREVPPSNILLPLHNRHYTTLLHQPGLGGGWFPGLEDVRVLQQLEGREDDAGGHGGMMLLLGDGCLLQATQHHQLQLRSRQTRQTCKECG